MGIIVIGITMLIVVLEGLSSYFIDRNFFPSQVKARWGQNGIAFVAHGGMWGDLILLPAIFAIVITRHSASWSATQIAVMLAIGVTVTAANHYVLITTQSIPDPLGWKKEWFSIPIALHFFYMTAYVALIGLFYFCSPGVSVLEVAVVSILLGIHVAFGTHIPLGLANLWFKWPWCPTTFLHAGAWNMNIVIWLLFIGFAWSAAGFDAAKLVLVAFFALVAFAKILLLIAPVPA